MFCCHVFGIYVRWRISECVCACVQCIILFMHMNDQSMLLYLSSLIIYHVITCCLDFSVSIFKMRCIWIYALLAMANEGQKKNTFFTIRCTHLCAENAIKLNAVSSMATKCWNWGLAELLYAFKSLSAVSINCQSNPIYKSIWR